MENTKEICKICQAINDTVIDGLCEECEKVWLEQIGHLSKELREDTSLAYLFHEATKRASEKIKQNKSNTR